MRKVIGVDFNFESIAANSRTSQIRQMMNKHLVIEEMQQKDEEQKKMDDETLVRNKYLNFMD